MAGQVFISYRRSYHDRVARLVDALRDAGYQPSELFWDTSDIEGGAQWRPQLERALDQARVVLAVVAPGWAQDKADDWVRTELETAQERQCEVVLATFSDAADELQRVPESLRPLLAGQAVTLRDPLTPHDVDALVRALRRFGVHPTDADDRWSDALRDDDVGRSADPLRRVVGDTLAAWRSGDERPHPPIVVVDGPPGSGRSATLRIVLGDRSVTGPTAAVALHRPTGEERGHEPAAVAATWVGAIVRWARAHGSEALQSDVAEAVVAAIRAGLDGRRLPSDLVGLLPVAKRSQWIAAAGEASQGDQRQLVTTVVNLLDALSDKAPLVLAADDVQLLDATSVEVVRHLAERIAEVPGRQVLLVLAALPGGLLDAIPPECTTRVDVGTPDLLDSFLERCGVADGGVREAMAAGGVHTAVEAVAYLHHLRLEGLLRRDGPEGWTVGVPPDGGWPQLAEALDSTIDRFVLTTWQKVVAVGALLGPVFPLAAAMAVGGHEEVTEEAVEQCWEELRRGDPDAVVLRVLGAPGGRIVAFSSSTWWRRLRDRLVEVERDVPFGALAAVVESRTTYDGWLDAARLYDQADEPEQAGDAYLRAARRARLGLSDESAARAYTLAAGELWESTQRGDSSPASMVRGLSRIAYCYYRAANLLGIAADDAASDTTRERLRRRGAQCLEDALQTLDAASSVMEEWRRHPSELPDLDQLVMDEADVLSEDDVRVGLMLNTLLAFAHLQRGRNFLADPAPDHAQAEHHLLLAMRHGNQGLSGILHQQLVVRAGAGLARAIVPRVERAASLPERRRAARASFLHGARALIVRAMVGERADDVQALRALDQSVHYVLLSRARLSELFELASLAQHVRHRQLPDEPDAPAGSLVTDVATLVSPPPRLVHAAVVRSRAQELFDAQGAALGLAHDTTVAEDVTIVAYAHDLLRDIDGSRLLAMALDARLPVDGPASDRPALLHGAVTAQLLDLDLGLADALGDRFERVRLAVETHTLGFDPATTPRHNACFAMALHLADARARIDLAPDADDDDGEGDDRTAPETIREWWQQALDGDVAGAYDRWRAWRASLPAY